jgi:hypothetical protein
MNRGYNFTLSACADTNETKRRVDSANSMRAMAVPPSHPHSSGSGIGFLAGDDPVR